MEFRHKFFDLDAQQVAELGVRIIPDQAGATVVGSSGEIFRICHGVKVEQSRELARYVVRFCRTGHSAEAQTSRIKCQQTGKTLGYVFPVTALRDGENIGEGWPRSYAEVGFRSVATIDSLASFSNAGSVSGFRGQTLFLDELVPDDLSILVLGKQNIEHLDISEETLQLMLLGVGITVVDDVYSKRRHVANAEWSSSLLLSTPDDSVKEVAASFVSLIRSSDQDETGVGAFLHLYQTLEFCIDQIFRWSIENIAKANLDTWEMKSRLSQITGEKYRLGILDSSCIQSLVSRDCLSDLRAVCREFLLNMKLAVEESEAWFISLYKVRNVVVHNQIKMMIADASLNLVNKCLRVAVLEILFAFALPDKKQEAN